MARTREELRDRLIDGFSARAEIWRICLFGREVEGRHDAYSDIDIIVHASDPARTKATYRDVFGAISPIRAMFTLGGTDRWYAEMVMLQDYSPYQKVDFSIGGKEDWPVAVVYDNPAKRGESSSGLEAVEIRRDAAYVLMDILFSVGRFTKCLFRRDVDMYRRWESITDLALVLLYERHFGWQSETLWRRLGAHESKVLIDALGPEEAAWLDRIRPRSARLDLALSYQAAIKLIAALSEEKALYQSLALDRAFIDYILAFLDAETARYRALPVASVL